MRKAVQKTISVSAACLAALVLSTACGVQEAEILPEDVGSVTAKSATSPEDEETVSADVETEEFALTPSEEELMSSGIVIDFPFPTTRDNDYKDAVLILVCVDESAGTYELRLYDKDKNIVQQIPIIDVYNRIVISKEDETCRTEIVYGKMKRKKIWKRLAV